MFSNKSIYILPMLIMLALRSYSQQNEFTSQPSGRGNYALVAYISGGPGRFISDDAAPSYLNPSLNQLNPVGTIRILWHPDHLLKAGLESGYVNFFSYNLTDSAGNKGKIALNAIPLLLEWSMSVTKRFNIFAGSGIYLLNTQLDYLGKTTSKKLSVGWMAAASYIFPLSKNTGLGTEAKWLYAAETSKGTICLQLQFVWKFLKW
ncbi:MAG TPA: hypothetical protein VNS32_19940 [Flavisolibacter sp.]|nr:hypothetical protein [Flavisolibacter sp.]